MFGTEVKTNNGKLIAAIAVLALIVCAFAVAIPAADAAIETEANPSAPALSVPVEGEYKVVTSFEEIGTTPGVYVIQAPTESATKNQTITISKDITIGSQQTVYIGEKFYANNTEGKKLTISLSEEATLTIEGTVYNNLGTNKASSPLDLQGDVVFSGNGTLYTTSAMISSDTRMVSGFYTTSENVNLQEQAPESYRQVYSGNISTVMACADETATYSGITNTGKAVLAYGDAQISRSVTLTTNLYLAGIQTVTLTVAKGATVTVPEDLVIGVGTNTTGKSLLNNGQINVFGENSIAKDVVVDPTSTGSISATTSTDAYLGGTIDKTTTQTNFGSGTTVNVIDDLIIDGAQITINGTMMVPEEFSVTIINGGSITINSITGVLENNGQIVVETDDTSGSLIINSGSTVNNNGTISFMCDSDVAAAPGTSIQGIINNKGTITVAEGDNNALTIAGTINNDAGATILLEGQVTATGAINNAGTVTIDGQVDATVSMNKGGAIVNVISSTGSLYINDTKLTDTSIVNSSKTNQVNITTVDTAAATGISVKSVVVEKEIDGEKQKYKTLDVSGTIGVNSEADLASGSVAVDVRLYGENITVTDALTFGEDGFRMFFGDNSTPSVITVSGSMTISDDVVQAPSGSVEITVTGTITSVQELDDYDMNAAYYSNTVGTQKTHYYTSALNAINSAAEAGVTKVYMFGAVELTADATIVDNMTVYVENDNIQVFKINEDVTLTVADGGRIDKTGTIDVDGTLYVTVERTGIRGNGFVISDVVSRGEADVTYTSLANAIANAGSDPVTITLNGDVLIKTNLTIPENVTVDTDSKAFEVSGATLTIDGTLYLNGTQISNTSGTGYYVHDTMVGKVNREASVVLNGYIRSDAEMSFDNPLNTDKMMFPAGAYYTTTIDNTTYSVITSVENSQNVLASAENSEIGIYGENTVGDLDYSGTADESAVITVYGKLTAGTISIDEATITFNGQEFDGTIAYADGSIAFTDAVVTGDISYVTVDDVKEFTISGLVDAVVDGTAAVDTYSTVFDGTVVINDLVIDGASINGDVTVTGTGSDLGKTTVNGTLTIDNDSSFSADEIVVLGTMNAVAATENYSAGSAQITALYVGISKDKGVLGAAVSASVSGSITADITYVSSAATVPEGITDGTAVKKTEFYVEDTLWMTAYTSEGTEASVGNAPVTDADFKGWNDSEGNLKYAETADSSKGIASYTDITVGTPDKLYASIKYDVYNVIITLDNTIGSVAIDGQMLVYKTGMGYMLPNDVKLTAGEHTVTYTLAANYEGTPTLSSQNVTVSGLTFTLSGDFEDDNDDPIYYYLSLGGATLSDNTVIIEGGNGGNGELGLTDYLLIILVILIVVMAIIVAMRLMRS